MTPRIPRHCLTTRLHLPLGFVSFFLLLAGALTAAAADSKTVAFDLPSDLAEVSLKRFSVQSSREVLFAAQVTDGIRTNAVKGRMTPTEALRTMLAKTGLVAVPDARTGAFSVRKEAGEETKNDHGAVTSRPVAPGHAPTAAPVGAGTSTISGRIYKPATGEYARSAGVRIVGTDRVAESDSDGTYRFSNLPAGEFELVVASIGYEPALGRVQVAAGESATRDFNLVARGVMRDGALQLETFQVTGEREGHAKALQDQKRSMNIGNVVGSEIFGDTSEGNAGEFLKYLPGVELDYVSNDARGPRLRGMDAQYVGVTLDGMKLASADAFGLTVGTENGGTDGSRAFGFESVSFSGVDSVEVFKTLSADLDADAPAGAINLRSKRAFDRKGRRVSWMFNLSGNSAEMYLRNRGPGDSDRHKIRPGGMLEYSDIFLGGRLGVVLNVNRSDSFNTQFRYGGANINRQTTATDSRVAVPQLITFTDSPKLNERTSETVTVDFKVNRRLNFGVSATFSQYGTYFDERTLQFTTSANNVTAAGRTSVVGVDPLVSFRTSPTSGSQLALVGGVAHKLTNSVTVTPRFEFKPTDTLTIDGRFGFSHAKNDYEALARGAAPTRVGALTAANSGLVFSASRPSPTSESWTVTQLAGRDWGDITSYGSPSIGTSGRLHINDVTSGQLDARWNVRRGVLRFLKVGLKSREERTDFRDDTSWNQWTYLGSSGTTAPTWAGFEGAKPTDFGALNARLPSISGRMPIYAGRERVAALFHEHPERFVQSGATAANYYTSFIGSVRDLTERIDGAYALANTQLGRLQIQGGLRVEETHAKTVSFDRHPRAEVIAARFAVDATGRATTIDGLKYQFESLPRLTREGSYRNWFPSLALKYSFSENLIAQAGFNGAISRPSLFALSGPVTVNEQNFTISAPNPTLEPEESQNYSARLAYYFEPTGTLSVGVFQNDFENFRGSFTYEDEASIAALGFDPGEYVGYEVVTQRNIAGSRRFRGMEIEYRQALSFLPGPFRGLDVFANYTRNYASIRRGGLSPHHVSTGFSFNYRRLGLNAKAIWTPDTPWTQNVATRYREERILTDVGASWRVSPRVNVELSALNVFNTPYRILNDGPEGATLTLHESFGAMWVLSLRGTF